MNIERIKPKLNNICAVWKRVYRVTYTRVTSCPHFFVFLTGYILTLPLIHFTVPGGYVALCMIMVCTYHFRMFSFVYLTLQNRGSMLFLFQFNLIKGQFVPKRPFYTILYVSFVRIPVVERREVCN